MPTLPTVEGVLRVAVKGVNHDEPWTNVFHVNIGPGLNLDAAAVNDFAGDFLSAFTTSFYPIMSQQAGARECVVTQLQDILAPSGTATDAGAGAVSGAIAPLSVSKLLRWSIARRYRGGHPRTYLAGVPQADVDVDGRLLVAAALTGTQTAAAAFLTAVNAITVGGGNAALAVVHYYRNNALLTVPLVDDVTAVQAQRPIATQRRRLQRA